MTDEELLDWVENANDGEGPYPIATYEGTALREIMDAVRDGADAEDRIGPAVDRAREEGATWAMIGFALRITSKGSLNHCHEQASA